MYWDGKIEKCFLKQGRGKDCILLYMNQIKVIHLEIYVYFVMHLLILSVFLNIHVLACTASICFKHFTYAQLFKVNFCPKHRKNLAFKHPIISGALSILPSSILRIFVRKVFKNTKQFREQSFFCL
jgi:hypothetical protein